MARKSLDTSAYNKIVDSNIPNGKPYVVIDVSEMWAGPNPKPCALAKRLHTSRDIYSFVKCKDTCVDFAYTDIGDYEIHIPLKGGKERVIGIERKTFSDYYGRLTMKKGDRKHLDHQLLRLVDKFGPENSYVLLEDYTNKPKHIKVPIGTYKETVWSGVNHRNLILPHFISPSTAQSVKLFKWLMDNSGFPTMEDNLFRLSRGKRGCLKLEDLGEEANE